MNKLPLLEVQYATKLEWDRVRLAFIVMLLKEKYRLV